MKGKSQNFIQHFVMNCAIFSKKVFFLRKSVLSFVSSPSLLSCGTGFSFSHPWVAMGNGQSGGIHLFFSLCMLFGKLL